MTSLTPTPHPLDFDWRYTSATAAAIAALLKPQVPILALGAPSIARLLEQAGRDVLLVDRQPLQGVQNHATCDVAAFRPASHFGAAIIDPPWYPDVVRDWIAVGAHGVQPGGTIFVSVWPPITRPSAAEELSALQAELKSWAKVEVLPLALNYEIPPFEAAAGRSSLSGNLSRSPRVGQLWQLTVWALPALPTPSSQPETWARFVLNDYQLAFRVVPPANGDTLLRHHPCADGWRWPFVSARAPERHLIGVWSSSNEVALLESSRTAVNSFRDAIAAATADDFRHALGAIPGLSDWSLPHPPFWRTLEWSHPR